MGREYSKLLGLKHQEDFALILKFQVLVIPMHFSIQHSGKELPLKMSFVNLAPFHCLTLMSIFTQTSINKIIKNKSKNKNKIKINQKFKFGFEIITITN